MSLSNAAFDPDGRRLRPHPSQILSLSTLGSGPATAPFWDHRQATNPEHVKSLTASTRIRRPMPGLAPRIYPSKYWIATRRLPVPINKSPSSSGSERALRNLTHVPPPGHILVFSSAFSATATCFIIQRPLYPPCRFLVLLTKNKGVPNTCSFVFNGRSLAP